MSKLLGAEKLGDRTQYTYLHTGDDGKDRITVKTVQDAEPILDDNKRQYNAAPQKYGSGGFHKVADIPATLIEEAVRINAARWGVRIADAYREIMQCKTDRARKFWNALLNASEYRALRTRPGRVNMKKRD